jgi:hypothetical protein
MMMREGNVLLDVFRESAVFRYATRLEILAEQSVAAAAVEAVVAGDTNIRGSAVADSKALDVFADLNDFAYCFMPWN